MSQSRDAQVRQMISQIPAGKVATYGQIADLCEMPRGARRVGYVLRSTPDGETVPWHRVVNSKGQSSFPVDSNKYEEQISRLAEEGVVFIGKKIDLLQCQWKISLADILFIPPH